MLTNGTNAVTQTRQSALLRLVETAAPSAENGTTRIRPVRQTNEERRPREHLSRGEVLEQAGHIVVDSVAIQSIGLDESLELRQAANIDGDLDAGVERSQPPGHRAPHG